MNRLDRKRQYLAIGLAGLAGFVDAVGFLSADGYFVSFMSGNTTRLGVNLARDLPAARIPALLIGGFVLGVALGAVVAARAGAARKPAVLTLVCALLVGGAASRGLAPAAVTLACLVGAMGALNNTFQRDGEVAVGLTYMTGALVKLGQAIGAAVSGGRRTAWGAHLLLWSGLALGAVLGALAFTYVHGAALWLAAGWCALMVLAAQRIREVKPPDSHWRAPR